MAAPVDLLSSLMNLNGGVAQPQGMPLQQGQNPLTGLDGLPAGSVPASTPSPDLTANLNPGKQVQSLEELLFGVS
jgi:hypothetical protein